jgi:hypothetical protein
MAALVGKRHTKRYQFNFIICRDFPQRTIMEDRCHQISSPANLFWQHTDVHHASSSFLIKFILWMLFISSSFMMQQIIKSTE